MKIGDDITIKLLKVSGNGSAKFGIDAPIELRVDGPQRLARALPHAMVIAPILFALLMFLFGCTSAPVARKTQLPPLPPGFKATRQSTARVTTTIVAATVAAVVPADEPRPVYIVPYGPGYYGVIGVQTNSPGGTLEFCMAPAVSGQPWQSLSTPFWVAQGETMMVMVPANWLPDRRLFVNVKSVPGAAPAAARAAAGVDSGKTIRWNGKQYRLVEVSQPAAQFKVYRLQL